MAGLDITGVLADPDFINTFSVTRAAQTVSSGGIASDTTQTFGNLSGVVQPDKGRTMQRLAEGAKLADSISIFTTFQLTAGRGPIEADQVAFNGANYVVVSVMDWSLWGAGFVKATCDLIDIS